MLLICVSMRWKEKVVAALAIALLGTTMRRHRGQASLCGSMLVDGEADLRGLVKLSEREEL